MSEITRPGKPPSGGGRDVASRWCRANIATTIDGPNVGSYVDSLAHLIDDYTDRAVEETLEAVLFHHDIPDETLDEIRRMLKIRP